MNLSVRLLVASIAFVVAMPQAGAGRVKSPKAVIQSVTQKLSRAIARKSGARALHARGDAYSATLELGAQNMFDRAAGPAKVTVRMSRATTAKQPKATPLGAAIRVTNGAGVAEDILMVSSGKGPILRRLFWPTTSFFGSGTRYSSLLPYQVKGKKQLFLLVAEDQAPRSRKRTSGTDLGELADRVDAGTATFSLMTKPLDGGEAMMVGRLVLEQRLPAALSRDLKFNPWGNQLLRPAGIINSLIRRAAYRGSQEGRSAVTK